MTSVYKSVTFNFPTDEYKTKLNEIAEDRNTSKTDYINSNLCPIIDRDWAELQNRKNNIDTVLDSKNTVKDCINTVDNYDFDYRNTGVVYVPVLLNTFQQFYK